VVRVEVGTGLLGGMGGVGGVGGLVGVIVAALVMWKQFGRP